MTDYSLSMKQSPVYQGKPSPAQSPTQPSGASERSPVNSATSPALTSDQTNLDTVDGSADVKVAFWGSDDFEAVSSIPKIHGLAQGDHLAVAGTGVSGNMAIKRWGKDELSIESSMDAGMLASLVETATGKEPVVKGGKMNLAFEVTKKGDSFTYSLKDANSPGHSVLLDGPVEVLQDSKKTKLRLKTDSVELTINIDEARSSSVKGSGSLSMGLLPLPGFTFAKR